MARRIAWSSWSRCEGWRGQPRSQSWICRVPSRPPLSCRASPPRGGRSDLISAFANFQRRKKSADRAICQSAHLWGGCPAGQRGAP
ncbi:MAG: hypothetical protein E5Y06_30165 [Mesorhizobium sp.]|nr:MAG: hypothetical protein E5Y06_30165 [Mesorhizobium sp.]